MQPSLIPFIYFFALNAAVAHAKHGFLYIAEPELVQKLNEKPAIGAVLLSSIIEKEVTLFPASILNPESGHGNPVVCLKVEQSKNLIREIKGTRLVFKEDPNGKICNAK